MPGNRCSNCIAYNFECSYIEAAKVSTSHQSSFRTDVICHFRNEVLPKGASNPCLMTVRLPTLVFVDTSKVWRIGSTSSSGFCSVCVFIPCTLAFPYIFRFRFPHLNIPNSSARVKISSKISIAILSATVGSLKSSPRLPALIDRMPSKWIETETTER